MKTFIELFAGAGMARLGLGPDWTCVLANDIDPKKGASYGANFRRDHLEVCVEVLDLDARNCASEFSPAEVARHLAMMSPVNLAKVESARAVGKPIAGAFYRRIRKLKDGTKVQRAEMRFDGLAAALRVASTGGSSVQFVLVVDGADVHMRALTARKYARLMGLLDTYRLPTRAGEARSFCGDGVCVSVVRHIAQHILEPLLEPALPSEAVE
jgi:site-specific DNA-cytosine methylase